MNITIKNHKTDKQTHGAIGFDCGRFQSRKSQLMGLHKAKLGNPHPIGWCDQCRTTHSRAECIQACSNDPAWRQSLEAWLIQFMDKHRHRHHVDLWCWCSPEDCHCRLIKERIEEAILTKAQCLRQRRREEHVPEAQN